jgi:Asp-tRNA(Asn)/Glu-tRNA(Gln) amidotransferase A subunit family amidase
MVSPSDALTEAAQYAALTPPVNVSGQPAISLPLGLTGAGLPFGLPLIGPDFAEGDILAIARQLEQAMPWRERRGPSGTNTSSRRRAGAFLPRKDRAP